MKDRPPSRFRVVARLGGGVMTEVHLCCLHGVEGFEKEVVVKHLTAEHATDPLLVRIFLDEARLAAKLSHRNIVQIFEMGEGEGGPYIAMEYVKGFTLATVIARVHEAGRVHYGHCAKIIAGICDALAYAHGARDQDGEPLGLVHRDLAAEDILVSMEGIAKLFHFGTAPREDTDPQVTARMDVFHVGLVLYELTTGVNPVDRNDPVSTESPELALRGGYRKPSQIAADYPPELERLVLAAIDPDSANPRPSAQELGDRLEELAASPAYRSGPRPMAAWLFDLFPDVVPPPSRPVAVLALPSSETEVTVAEPRPHRRDAARVEAPPPARVEAAAPSPGSKLREDRPVLAPARSFGTPGPSPVHASQDARPLVPASESSPRPLPGGQGGFAPPPTLAGRGGRIRKWLVFAAVAFAAGSVVVAVWRRLPPIGITGVPPPQIAHVPPVAPTAPPSAAEPHVAVPAEPTARPDAERSLPIAVPERNGPGTANTASRKNDTGDRTRPNPRRRPGRRKASAAQRTAQSHEAPPRPETARDPKQPNQPVPARPPEPTPPVRSPGELAAGPVPPPPGSVEKAPPARPAATISTMPRSPVPIPSLPRVVRDPEPEELARVCHAVEAAAITLAGVSPEFARGITEPFRRAVSGPATIYPIGMYYFVVREAGSRHDSVTAAANLVSAQSSGAILRFKDLPGKDTNP